MASHSTSPIPSYLPPPSSRREGQSTPSLIDHQASHDASSSPPSSVLTTPVDSEKLPANARKGNVHGGRKAGGGGVGMNAIASVEPVARRSVRVRGASNTPSSAIGCSGITGGGGGQNASSLQSSSPGPDHFTSHSIPSSSSTSSSSSYPQPPPLVRSSSRGGGGSKPTTRLPTVSRASSIPLSTSSIPPPPPATTNATSSTLHIAQSHGITPDQFEQHKQQVMKFLSGGADNNLASSSSSSRSTSLPTTSSNSRAVGGGKNAFTLHSQSHSHTTRLGDPFVESTASTTSSSAAINARLRNTLPSTSTTSSTDVRRWAEDSDDEEVDSPKQLLLSPWSTGSKSQTPKLGNGNTSTSAGTPRFGGTPKVLGGTPRLNVGGTGVTRSPRLTSTPTTTEAKVVVGSSLKGKGIMELFMSGGARAGEEDEEEEESDELESTVESKVEQVAEKEEERTMLNVVETMEVDESREVDDPDFSTTSQADLEAAIVLTSPISRRAKTPNSPVLAPITGSPIARRALGFSPNAMMTSPVQGGSGVGLGGGARHSSIFDSPDVEKLLKNELKRMRTEEGSPGILKGKRPDELEAPFSSPYQPYGTESPNNSPRNKRARFLPPIATSDGDATHRPVSPTPSTSSLQLRAPSFCDSSPAVSENASQGSVGGSSHRPPYPFSSAQQPHPASAPDYYHHHSLPSQCSSPTSSQASYTERSHLPTHHNNNLHGAQSSPGPQFHSRAFPPKSAPQPDTYARKRVAPIKRSNTSPAVMGPDGSYAKPSWSYAALIGQAIFSTEDCKISLADIYTFIMKSYPYYKKGDSGWQNSIRHNLSLNECFIKTARGSDNPGKGCLWAIAAGCEDQFADGGFTKKVGNGGTATVEPKGKKGRHAPKSVQATTSVPSMPARFDPTSLLRSGPTSHATSSVASIVPPSSSAASGSNSRKRERDTSPSPIGFSPAKTLAALSSSRSNLSRGLALDVSSPARPALQFGDQELQFGSSGGRGMRLERPESDMRRSSPAVSVSAPMQVEEERESTPVAQEDNIIVEESIVTEKEVTPPHREATPVTSREASTEPSSSQPVTQQSESQAAPSSSIATTHHLSERRDSVTSLSSLSSLDEPLVEKSKLEPLAPAYVHRPSPAPTSAVAPVTATPSIPPRREAPSRGIALASPVAASPPTSVYHRLAGPYQPISYSQSSSAHNHRALALLASPEATGIMPVHPSVYERSNLPGDRSPVTAHPHFLPAPHIFPGSASRRATREEEKDGPEGAAGGSMLLSRSFVHTQSPVSSVRGGGAQRAPMSPLQAGADADMADAESSSSASLFSEEDKFEPLADPEKKRGMGMRHLPAVAALADASETFRTPPRLRSPSSSTATTRYQPISSGATPGRSRPWNTQTPGRVGGANGASPGGEWGWGADPFGGRAEVEAELERFWMRGEAAQGSAGNTMTPRFWSPGAPLGGGAHAW